MTKIYNNLVYLFVIILLAIIFFFVFYQFFWNKGSASGVQITNIKNHYSVTEDVVLAGYAKEGREVILAVDGKMGITKSDENGKWTANLGKMNEGKYALSVISDDSQTSRSVTTAQISVASDQQNISFLDSFSNLMTAAISFRQKAPEKLIMIPTSTPPVLNGNWKLLK